MYIYIYSCIFVYIYILTFFVWLAWLRLFPGLGILLLHGLGFPFLRQLLAHDILLAHVIVQIANLLQPAQPYDLSLLISIGWQPQVLDLQAHVLPDKPARIALASPGSPLAAFKAAAPPQRIWLAGAGKAA